MTDFPTVSAEMHEVSEAAHAPAITASRAAR